MSECRQAAAGEDIAQPIRVVRHLHVLNHCLSCSYLKHAHFHQATEAGWCQICSTHSDRQLERGGGSTDGLIEAIHAEPRDRVAQARPVRPKEQPTAAVQYCTVQLSSQSLHSLALISSDRQAPCLHASSLQLSHSLTEVGCCCIAPTAATSSVCRQPAVQCR